MNPSASHTDMVSMRTLRNLIDSVVKAGVPRARFLSAAHLDPACLDVADARLTQCKLFELIELALDLTADPALGLHSIEQLPDAALNPLTVLVTHASTLRDALRSIQEFRCLLGDAPSFRHYEEGGKLFVLCSALRGESPRVRRFMAELALVGLFRLIQRFRGESRVECVAFDYAAPEYLGEYARVFEQRASFEQPFTGLCLSADVMTAVPPYADPELHAALRTFAQRRVMHLTQGTSYAERIRDLLLWQPPPRDMTMATVARKLGVSVRSLRRHLTSEGRPFPELVNESLAAIAKNCLRDERRSILATAFELGFSDNTSFHRAFKRWTGMTPQQYRREHVRGEGPSGGDVAALGECARPNL